MHSRKCPNGISYRGITMETGMLVHGNAGSVTSALVTAKCACFPSASRAALEDRRVWKWGEVAGVDCKKGFPLAGQKREGYPLAVQTTWLGVRVAKICRNFMTASSYQKPTTAPLASEPAEVKKMD